MIRIKPFLRNPKYFLPSLILFISLAGLSVLLASIQTPQSQRAEAQVLDPNSLGCSEITTNKNVYDINEVITVNVKGYGNLNDIIVWQMPASQNLIQDNPWIWERVSGTYNSSTKTWTGNMTAKKNGEFIISANIKQSNGMVCAGNPGYMSSQCPDCQNGTFAWAGINPGTYSCHGCRKTIAVSQNYNKTTGYDMKRYWNMSPGYYWDYSGENSFNTPTVTFNTRIGIEQKTNICGFPMLPVRYTKNKSEGYIFPYGHTNNLTLSNRNLRFFLSYFEPNQPWSATTMGHLLGKLYNLDLNSPYPLGNLGTKRPDDIGLTFATKTTKEISKPFENTFYSPYFYSETRMNTGYTYNVIDKLYKVSSPDQICNINYDPKAPARYFEEKLFTGSVDTPAYKGPVIILRQTERGASWFTREDWYLAENKGIVQIEKDNLLNRNCFSSSPHNNCNLNNVMNPAPLRIKLTDYYVGGKLTVQLIDQGTNYYKLSVTSPRGNYTGWLEAKTCISDTSCTQGAPFKWNVWTQDGIAYADLTGLNLRYGLRHSMFRPWIEKTPPDESGETLIPILSTEELPWSDEVLIRH